METLRLADPLTGKAYPLPIAGAAAWRPMGAGVGVDLALPALAAGTLVVPSLALPGAGADYHQWELSVGAGAATAHWRLPAVPSDAAAQPQIAADARVSLQVDCWQVHEPLVGPHLRVWLPLESPPQRYLLTVSARPLALTDPAVPAMTRGLTAAPPALSQMQAAPDIAPRICSPTSIAMVLAHWGCRDPWLQIVSECRDPATGMFGVWPLAIAAAARRGSVGAVELFDDWTAPLRALERGIPLVASIRFDAGALPGAPLLRSAGHLVVVFKAGPDTIGVNDPAAASVADVTRTYPAKAFTEAWLGHRGAAYILPP